MSDDAFRPGDRLTSTPAGVTLGAVDIVADGAARGFVLEIGGRRFHGFVVRRGEAIHGYVDRCPHMGVPLARELDAYLSPLSAHIACGWHGALFRIDDGTCVGGPCMGAKLIGWPVVARDGMLVTV